MADYLVTDTELKSVADAIRTKGGTTEKLEFPTGFISAVESISSGGVLPELTNPAAAGDVVAGKEYIDGAGAKQEGVMVVCDTVAVVEAVGRDGVGLEVEIESPADRSTKILTLPEINLLPDNIKSGVNIFGVIGSAKTLRVETGTITPAEDTTTLSIPCSANPKYAVLITTSETAAEGDILGAICANVDYTNRFVGNCFVNYYYRARIRSSTFKLTFDSGISIPEISSVCFYRAGVAYQWTAYYWEDT